MSKDKHLDNVPAQAKCTQRHVITKQITWNASTIDNKCAEVKEKNHLSAGGAHCIDAVQ